MISPATIRILKTSVIVLIAFFALKVATRAVGAYAGTAGTSETGFEALIAQLAQAGANSAAAAGLYKLCSPKNPYPCVLAALAVDQARAALSASKGSAKTARDSAYIAGRVGATDPVNMKDLRDEESRIPKDIFTDGDNSRNRAGKEFGLPDGVTGQSIERELNQIDQGLSNQGLRYNAEKKGMETPEGFVGAAGITTAEGQAALGLSALQVQGISEALASAKKEVQLRGYDLSALNNLGGENNRSLASIDGSGGRWKTSGSGAQPGGHSNSGEENAMDYNKILERLHRKGPKVVAGLQRKVTNGEAIGVSADSIFEMIRRRYQANRDRGKLITEH